MYGYRSLVIGLCILGAFLVNHASADLIDYIHYDKGKSMAQRANNRAPSTVTTSGKRLAQAGLTGKTRYVKIGSHVLRGQLLEQGCIEAHQVQFLKCPAGVLDQTLANYTPVR